jgi:uncharacterized membrane protein
MQVQGTSATIIIGIVDIILLLRIWILYERARRTLYVLLAMIIGEFDYVAAAYLTETQLR